MKLRHLLSIACTLSLGLTASAWAIPADAGTTDLDAGSTGGADDATATADAGSSDAATSDTGGGGGVDTSKIDPCWVSKCPKEFDACKADPNCVAFVVCNYDSKCIQAITGMQQASADLGLALQKCGGKACTDPNAGSCKGKCGQFISADKCHCDDPCVDYGDCCGDKATICGDGSCAKSDCADGSAGAYLDGSQAQCGCGSDCETNNDCCADYPDTCQGKTPACTPACTNKDGSAKACGPDGCGGSCGTCKAGEKCTAGACTGGSTGGADAGSTADSATGGGADAGLTADTGSTGGTGATDGTGTAKSSGCTAGSTGNSAGWASALIALGLLVVARRRHA